MFLGAEGATAIDEGLFEDEDLDELEDDLQNLVVWITCIFKFLLYKTQPQKMGIPLGIPSDAPIFWGIYSVKIWKCM